MNQDNASPVAVQILDKEYRINCAPEERPGLLESARLLDERMRQVRQSGRVLGGDRIAVMAALNLIYELVQERDALVLGASRLQALQERVGHAVSGQPEAPST